MTDQEFRDLKVEGVSKRDFEILVEEIRLELRDKKESRIRTWCNWGIFTIFVITAYTFQGQEWEQFYKMYVGPFIVLLVLLRILIPMIISTVRSSKRILSR